MKRFLTFFLFFTSVLVSWLHAQLSISGQLPRSNYMLYERIDFTVSMTNNSDSDILLNNDEEPWIRFLITDSTGLPIPSVGKATFPALTIPAGETKNITINITPLYHLRQTGDFKVCPVVDLPGQGEIVGGGTSLKILNGRRVWSESRTLEGSERVFSLLTFSPLPDRSLLYLRVEDADQNAVYANLALGNVVGGVPPQVRMDAGNNIHVLQCIMLKTYLYTRATVNGAVVHQSVFRTANEYAPRLVEMEGNAVTVAGGREQNEQNRPDRLSDGQNGKIVDSPPDTAKTANPANAGHDIPVAPAVSGTDSEKLPR